MRRVSAGGAATRVHEAGPADDRQAVVFVHGIPGSADDWVDLVAAVGATGRRAVALDLPDFGDTLAPAGFDHAPETYATWLGAAIAALGIDDVHLVLHDFAGPIGLLWVAADPDVLASIVLVDTGLLPGYHRWHGLARIWRTPVLGELFQATASERWMRLSLRRTEPRPLPGAFVDAMARHYDARTKRAILRLFRATENPAELSSQVTALLAPRDVPALVVWGAHDAYLPAAYARHQRAAFPSAEIHVLADSGHWPFADAPAEVRRLLLDFLRTSAESDPTAA